MKRFNVRTLKPECPCKCDVCQNCSHHWLPNPLDPEDEEDRLHPAFAKTDGVIWSCKHCECWTSIDPDDLWRLHEERRWIWPWALLWLVTLPFVWITPIGDLNEKAWGRI